MELTNSESPATPVIDDCISTHDKEIFYGLTKREAFAVAAMQGLGANSGGYIAEGWEESIARDAVTMADALLKELAK
jgi:hypothetical protein